MKKSSFYHTPFYSTPPLGGFPSEYRHPLWDGKTRMVSLPDGEKISKISLFVLAQLRNVTDRQTDRRTPGDSYKTALMHIHRAVKTRELIENTYCMGKRPFLILLLIYMRFLTIFYAKKHGTLLYWGLRQWASLSMGRVLKFSQTAGIDSVWCISNLSDLLS